MTFKTLNEFDKDLKRLLKKYRTLESDLADIRKVLSIRPEAFPPFSYFINDLGLPVNLIKVRRIASDSFKGKGNNSGFRLIYAYSKDLNEITFIELYHKGIKEKEDRARILKYFL